MVTTQPWVLMFIGAMLPVLVGTGTSAVGATLSGAVPAPESGAYTDTVLVAARELPRGSVLAAGDIDTLIVADGQLPARGRTGAAAEPGWLVRRLVHRGEPLRSPAVVPPALIDAGSPVTLVWKVGDMHITRQGTAVGPAYHGENVVVRVDATRRFTGIAVSRGTVLMSTAP